MRMDQAAERIWQVPDGEVKLSPDAVHVWRAWLDQPQPLEDFLVTLAPDEKARAVRFRFQQHRERFIIARGLLRAMLGRYLKIKPESLSFGYGAHGKPFLAGVN